MQGVQGPRAARAARDDSCRWCAAQGGGAMCSCEVVWQSTRQNSGDAHRARAAALERTLAALAALPSRAEGAFVPGRAHSPRVNATDGYEMQYLVHGTLSRRGNG